MQRHRPAIALLALMLFGCASLIGPQTQRFDVTFTELAPTDAASALKNRLYHRLQAEFLMSDYQAIPWDSSSVGLEKRVSRADGEEWKVKIGFETTKDPKGQALSVWISAVGKITDYPEVSRMVALIEEEVSRTPNASVKIDLYRNPVGTADMK